MFHLVLPLTVLWNAIHLVVRTHTEHLFPIDACNIKTLSHSCRQVPSSSSSGETRDVILRPRSGRRSFITTRIMSLIELNLFHLSRCTQALLRLFLKLGILGINVFKLFGFTMGLIQILVQGFICVYQIFDVLVLF